MSRIDFLKLACQACRWRPDPTQPMGLVRAHFVSEHPELVKEDGSPDMRLDMVAVCPRCDVEIPLFRSIDLGSDTVELEYVCQRCHRGYGVTQNKQAS